ncbi:hypothetical protein LSH36_303g02026 [Paralvinella palmiformis]|uniref:N-acetylneuraminate lyase n=1 Tax=Paralvinella palmiformis TaxID=53620 RepID=A0AAD9JIC6_9ANNE|nr:hypothetical protein LSH36_303g02026 [Paralvinella palmiformis]
MYKSRLTNTFHTLNQYRQCGYKVRVTRQLYCDNTVLNTTTRQILRGRKLISPFGVVFKRHIWFTLFRNMTADKIKDFWIKGFTSAPVTPFDEKQDLNLSLIKDYVEHFQQYGISNAFVTGTTGEGHSLTISERKQVVEAWIKEGKGNWTLRHLCHINHFASDRIQIILGKFSQIVGPLAVMTKLVGCSEVYWTLRHLCHINHFASDRIQIILGKFSQIVGPLAVMTKLVGCSEV